MLKGASCLYCLDTRLEITYSQNKSDFRQLLNGLDQESSIIIWARWERPHQTRMALWVNIDYSQQRFMNRSAVNIV